MIGYIYKTTNLKNGKIYIGKHIATQFEPNKYIGSSCLFKQIVARDGAKNFNCELLEECDTLEELNERERYYIKLFNSQDRSIGYNIADGGDDVWNAGKKMSLQYCEKNKKAQRDHAPNICCFDLQTGKLLQVFNSSLDAAEWLFNKEKVRIETRASRITTVCLSGKGHAYGYIWRYEQEYLDIINLPEEELLLEHINPRAKKIGQYSLDNKLIAEWESAAAFARTQALDSKCQRHIAKTINETCRGRYKTYKGYIWRYI